MVVVFRITNDYEYRGFALENSFFDGLFDKHLMPFDGEPLADSWRIVKAEILDSKSKVGSFFSSMLGALAMTDETKDAYVPLLANFGEFLPVSLEGERVYLFNTTYFSDALDQQKSERPMASYGPGMTSKFVFDKRALGVPPVFHLPNDAMDIFTAIDTDMPPEASFLGLYKKRNDTGLLFEEVWNSEGRDVNPTDVNKLGFNLSDLISARKRERKG